MNRGKKIGITVSAIIIVLLLAVAGGSIYMLSYSLTPHEYMLSKKRSAYLDMYANYPYLEPWVDSLRQASALKDTFIISSAGERLHAIYVHAPQPTKKTALIVHGYTDSAIRMLMIGYLYNKNLGYNILLPDLHAHGESDGNAIQMGWKDRLDVLRWSHVADSIFGRDTRMVVHGISMGGATTMMLSGEENLPEYIRCYVDDCGYTDVWSEFAYQLKDEFGLPEFPLLFSTSMLCKLRYGWSFGEASALEQVKRCHKPMLFIHGDADTYVPTDMVYRLYDAKPQPKELWIVPGATHAASYRDKTDDYVACVKCFTEKYIY